MSHVEPKSADDLAALEPVFAAARAAMGFVPNSMLTMAHLPQLPVGFLLMANVAFGGDLKATLERLAPAVPERGDAADGLPPSLVQLIAYASSVAAGCRYCQAHTSHGAHRLGVDAAKLDQILAYETSPVFSAAERAAVGLALAASAVPNESGPEHFAALRQHFTERQIVQIVAVIALFGFLNRWNDTMATQLESEPAEFAARNLGGVDWRIGKHAAG